MYGTEATVENQHTSWIYGCFQFDVHLNKNHPSCLKSVSSIAFRLTFNGLIKQWREKKYTQHTFPYIFSWFNFFFLLILIITKQFGFSFFRNCKILVGILQLSAALAQLATTVSFLNSMLNQYLTSGDFVRISQFDCCTKPFLFTSFFPSLSFFLHLLLFLSLSLSLCLSWRQTQKWPLCQWHIRNDWSASENGMKFVSWKTDVCLFVYFFVVETLLFHLRSKVFINLQVVRFNSIIFPENANQNGQHCVLLRFQIIIHLNNLLFSLVGWRIWIWEEKKKHT